VRAVKKILKVNDDGVEYMAIFAQPLEKVKIGPQQTLATREGKIASRKWLNFAASGALLQKFTGHTGYCGKYRFIPTIECGQNIFCNRA
jgi:hypothetical protein